MKKRIGLFILCFSIWSCISEQTNEAEEWAAMHESKSESIHEFNENKFGMIIHFGVYSSLGGYWNGEKVPGEGETIMRKAEISREDYKEVARRFNPAKFDAEEWVEVAKNAGMRYIVAMAKHADGFSMYDSEVTDYDIVDFTEFGRDPMQELYNACQNKGVNFSIYYNFLDWMDGGNGRISEYEKAHPNEDKSYQYWANTWDPSPVSFEDYFENKCKPQLRELLQRFPGIQEVWHDMPMKITPDQSLDIYKLTYSIQPTAMDNSRIGNDFGDFWIPGDNIIPEDNEVYDHYGVSDDLEKIQSLPWETPGTMNNTWGYQSFDNNWKSTKELLFWLTSIVSRGGNYLLNIGPTGEGLFPDECLDRLRDIGDWMKINGESVYGTHKWTVYQEGPTKLRMEGSNEKLEDDLENKITSQDFWFTTKGGSLYITSLRWPETNEILVKSLNRVYNSNDKNIASVDLLGSDQTLDWTLSDEGLEVKLSDSKPCEFGYVLKVIVAAD